MVLNIQRLALTVLGSCEVNAPAKSCKVSGLEDMGHSPQTFNNYSLKKDIRRVFEANFAILIEVMGSLRVIIANLV